MPQSSLVAARSYAPHSAIHHTARLMLQRKSHAGAQRVTQRVWRLGDGTTSRAFPRMLTCDLKKAAARMAFSSACAPQSPPRTCRPEDWLCWLSWRKCAPTYQDVIDPKSPGLFPARIASLIRAHVDAFCVDLASTPLGNATFCVEPFSS